MHERPIVEPCREAAVGADEEALAVAAPHEVPQRCAQLTFAARGRLAPFGLRQRLELRRQLQLGVGERADVASEQARLDDRVANELERLEPLERLREVAADA